MPAYRVQALVDAPPELVFACVADLERHGEWSSDPLEVRKTGDGAYTSTATSKGKTITATLRVLEDRPPERFAFEVKDMTGSWVNRFTLTPAEAETRVEREIAGELGGAQLLLFWLVLYPIKKPNARRSLQRLKALLEQ